MSGFVVGANGLNVIYKRETNTAKLLCFISIFSI